MNPTVALISIPLNLAAAVLLWNVPARAAKAIAVFNLVFVGWNLMVLWRAYG